MQDFIDFITNTNVIEVRNEDDFHRFREMLSNHGVMEILKNEKVSYKWWRNIAILNGDNPDLILFGFQNGKGLSMSSDYEKAVEWYGINPIRLCGEETEVAEADSDECDDEDYLEDFEEPVRPEINISVSLSEDRNKWTFTIAFGDMPAGMGSMDYNGETEEEAIRKIREESKIDQLYASYYGEVAA